MSRGQLLVLVQVQWAAPWVGQCKEQEQGPGSQVGLLLVQEQELPPRAEEAGQVLVLEVFGGPGLWWRVLVQRLVECWQGAGLQELWQQVAELWGAVSGLSHPQRVQPQGPVFNNLYHCLAGRSNL